MHNISSILAEERFAFLSSNDREFILAFDHEMEALGYSAGGNIGSGYCWGKYMVIYTKTGVKAKRVAARIYIRPEGLVLRLFVNKIDAHRQFIESAPEYIQRPFIDARGTCRRCHNEKDTACRFRKSYTLFGRLIEKCNGETFEFHQPDIIKLPGYMDLLRDFYMGRKAPARPAIA